MRDADTAAGLGEMLRSLKERAGLSYGALAGRLHLSASTLHRYCTGTSVPAEFAPVERFGRICRADPEELLELHRRWAVADEARRGRGASPSEGAEVPVPAPAPVVQSPPTVAEPTPRARQLVSRYVLLGAAVVALSTSGALAIDRFRAESVPDLTVPAIMAPDPSTEEVGAAGGNVPLSAAVVPSDDNCPRTDGTRTRPTTFRLKVRSTAEGPVTMTAMDVRVLSAEASPAEVTYADCRGTDVQHPFAVDLDAPEPRAVSPRRGFPYEVSAGTPLALDVTAHTSKSEVRWYLELRWTQGPRSGTVRIDDGGHPFRTGAVK
ncbi:helix-turn-helix domain-containing protein [Streptomyces sp. Go40/10]|uniref:helix-turn-helix domain-containing protein n=1 Tax=Streptomyces sp. Go40/10 TaxID=2825844 RepID=UPI001E4E6AD2|nr:helix-turn-helix transcriptional regulator [Streptomyces sp. Go40/10]UFR00013.1 helix-turn-helix domain-containing protein [Streptomyces sp. Go40/10]